MIMASFPRLMEEELYQTVSNVEDDVDGVQPVADVLPA